MSKAKVGFYSKTIDFDKLIRLVFERRCIWDSKAKNYNNRDMTKAMWKEIGEILGCSTHFAKVRWWGLRDTFRREYLKMLNGTTETCSWKHYESMLYLSDSLAVNRKQKKSSKTVNDEDSDNETDKDNNNDNFEEEDTTITEDYVAYLDEADFLAAEDSSNAQPHFEEKFVLKPDLESPANSTSTTNKNKRKRSSTTAAASSDDCGGTSSTTLAVIEQLLALKEQKMRSQPQTDEDYHFLMSLLPHLREVPKQRKLDVRKKLMEVILSETDGINREVRAGSPRGSSGSGPVDRAESLRPN